MEERIAFAEQRLLNGMPPAHAAYELQEEFKITRYQAFNVLQKVLVVMNEQVTSQIPHFRGLVVNRLNVQIAAAMTAKQWRHAIAGEAELSKILGLRAPLRMQINTDDSVRDAIAKSISGMSNDAREAMIREQYELEQKAKATKMNGHAKGGHDAE